MISSLHLYLYIRQHCSVKKNRACQGCANVCEIILIIQQMVAHIVFSLCWLFPTCPPLCWFPFLLCSHMSGLSSLVLGPPSFLFIHALYAMSSTLLVSANISVQMVFRSISFFPFQSFRLKSPITCWALPLYSKLSMCKVTYTSSSLEFLLHCLSIHSSLFIEAFYAQGSVQDIGNTIVSKK